MPAGEPLTNREREILAFEDTDTGHDLYWEDTTTTAIPSPDEATTLNIPHGTPVLIHTRVTHNSDGTPLALEETRLPTDRVSITGIQRLA